MAMRRGLRPLPILAVAIAVLIFPQAWAQAPGAAAPTRYALVIGNGTYTGMPSLKNPANDAADMAAALPGPGFSVTLLVDANRKTIKQAIVAFRETLARRGVEPREPGRLRSLPRQPLACNVPEPLPRPPSAYPPLRLPTGAVGQTLVDLEGSVEIVRIMETNLGRLIAAGLRRTAGADIGLMNSGGIRASIPAGYITEARVSDLLPFGNRVVSMMVAGAELRAILENGVSKLPADDGRFPQLSRASFTFDAARRVGRRVTDILVGEKPVDPKQTYRLPTVDYVANGGDGYSMLAGKPATDHGSVINAFLSSLGLLGQITEEKVARKSERSPAVTSSSAGGPTMSVFKYTGGILVSAGATRASSSARTSP